MFEEPFRWMEAISTRHSYVQEKLAKGQPVIAVPFNEGAVIFGFTPQPGKVFEIYDRIALGGMGHPADVERLRMNLLDLAHLEGFNRSEKDVTLTRLLQFGIAPALKQNFEEVMRAPYLVKLLLVEIDFQNKPQFIRLNYDGHWETFHKGSVISGIETETKVIQEKINEMDFTSFSLKKALQEGCVLWEKGKQQNKSSEDEEDDKDQLPSTLKEAFKQWEFEGAILNYSSQRKTLYRALTSNEIDELKTAF